MSARASAYVKSLTVCPNGEMISPREKLVAMVLADSHQDRAGRFTYPAVETIAEESMCDKRSCQRYLAGLERKGVIRRLRPENQGRAQRVFYFFSALDEVPEGWQAATLFFEERAAKGRQKGGRRVTESRRALMERAQEREQEQKQQQQTHPPTPAQAGEDANPQSEPTGKQDGGTAIESAAPDPAELDAEQRACVERYRSAGREREAREWEAFYRELMVKEAREAREREERAQAQAAEDARLRALMPDRAAAVRWTMDECGFTASRRGRGVDRAIADQLELENRRAEWHVTAVKMAAAWKQHRDWREPRAAPYGPEKFFRLGIWRSLARVT